jgi:hypothetical protein
MQRHHTGSGRRRVIPKDWGRDHAPVVATSRNAVGSLRHASPADTNPDDSWATSDQSTHVTPGATYASNVPARIQSLITHRSDTDRDVAEEILTSASYLVTIDIDWPVREGDLYAVDQCDGDTTLQTRLLRIEHVVRGTERFERDLFCNLLEAPATT